MAAAQQSQQGGLPAGIDDSQMTLGAAISAPPNALAIFVGQR
jgi:hypothetical protein